MKDYVFLFRGGLDFRTASPEQLQKAMQKWQVWMDKLAKDGRLSSSGNRLADTGSVIKGEKKQVFEGPYVEGKEIVGGFIAVKAADLKEAIEISKGCPIFDFGGSTEVREVAAM
jgi:hypothetical protein